MTDSDVLTMAPDDLATHADTAAKVTVPQDVFLPGADFFAVRFSTKAEDANAPRQSFVEISSPKAAIVLKVEECATAEEIAVLERVRQRAIVLLKRKLAAGG